MLRIAMTTRVTTMMEIIVVVLVDEEELEVVCSGYVVLPLEST